MLQINKIKTEKGCLYYCENNEEESFFMNEISNDAVVSKIFLLKSYKRRLEKYTVHYILQQIYPNGYQLSYFDNGKPFLENTSDQISISHSKNMVVVFISNTINIGVDVEEISKKVKKIAPKFISEQEQLMIKGDEDYTLIWGAKEAIYKSYEISGVDFKQGMNVMKIDKDSKELKLMLNYKELNTFCKLQYHIINGFTLVYHE